MKKNYDTPAAEKVRFCYTEQVAASNCGTDGGLDDILGPYLDYLVDNCKRYLPETCTNLMNIFG